MTKYCIFIGLSESEESVQQFVTAYLQVDTQEGYGLESMDQEELTLQKLDDFLQKWETHAKGIGIPFQMEAEVSELREMMRGER